MARRKSSHRGHRAKRTRRTKHTKHSRRTKRSHRTRSRRARRGGAPYAVTRMMPLNQEQTLCGGYFSKPHQSGGGSGSADLNGSEYPASATGGKDVGGIRQPSGSTMVVGGSNGQMATYGVTGGRF
jgi:hypothetical protein